MVNDDLIKSHLIKMFSVAIISDLHDWHSAQIEHSLKSIAKKY